MNDKELQALADKATPRPWEVHEARHIDGEFWASIGYHGRGPITDIVGAEGNKAEYFQSVAGMKYLVTPVEEQKANAAYIVAACNELPRLLDEKAALLRRIEALRAALVRLRDTHTTRPWQATLPLIRQAIAADDRAQGE